MAGLSLGPLLAPMAPSAPAGGGGREGEEESPWRALALAYMPSDGWGRGRERIDNYGGGGGEEGRVYRGGGMDDQHNLQQAKGRLGLY